MCGFLRYTNRTHKVNVIVSFSAAVTVEGLNARLPPPPTWILGRYNKNMIHRVDRKTYSVINCRSNRGESKKADERLHFDNRIAAKGKDYWIIDTSTRLTLCKNRTAPFPKLRSSCRVIIIRPDGKAMLWIQIFHFPDSQNSRYDYFLVWIGISGPFLVRCDQINSQRKTADATYLNLSRHSTFKNLP